MSKSKARRLTIAAMMGALSFILMYFSFSIPILSPFAEFDFSPLPELIGGFMLGPVGAVEIIVSKILLKLAFQGTTSQFTGELQNLILSIAYVLPAVLYYGRHKSKKGAIIGLVIGSVLSVIVAIFTNLYIIFPFFMFLYGMDWDAIVSMCTTVNPWITNVPTMVAFSVVPFNLISRTVTSIIVLLVYKRLSVPLKKLL